MATDWLHGVYLLTPDLEDIDTLLSATDAALAAGVRWVQYRHKRAAPGTRLAQARALRRLTRQHDARLIINDNVGLAQAVAADGVHLGRDDASVAEARQALGPAAVIGASAYNDSARAQALDAAGANYVAFGALFASRTKPAAVAAPLSLLGAARAQGLIVVGIGGINLDNIEQVAAAGAHAAALITSVYDASDPGRAAAALIAAFARGATAITPTSST